MPTLIFTRMFPDVLAPHYSSYSVHIDIHAYIKTETRRPSKMMIPPSTTRSIPTGLLISAPSETVPLYPDKLFSNTYVKHYTVLITSCAGMAREHSIFVANSPGVIDPVSGGELRVLLYNGGVEAEYIEDGDKIAQLLLIELPIAQLLEV